MFLKDFRIRLIVRVLFLALTIGLLYFMVSKPQMLYAAILTGIVIIFQLSDIINHVNRTNRKLTRFLDSIRYSDFISGFSVDNKLGESFKELNASFNDVLEAFRKTRSEKEEHWQYLNSVVEQVRTGILSYNSEGSVELINTNAKRFLGVQNLAEIKDLHPKDPALYKAIFNTKPGESTLFRGKKDMHLAIQVSGLRMRGQFIKLVTLQNIQTELQRQELDAWQNLTRVLRHEIMNSITPISSLTSTLKEVLEYDLEKKGGEYVLSDDSVDDLREGLKTIESRSKGLITFVDAYREYTSLPMAKIRTVRIMEVMEKVALFMKPELKSKNIDFEVSYPSAYLTIQADAELIEQVLINLIKNAKEALDDTAHPSISLIALYEPGSIRIEVMDNGPGIIEQAIESIFVPFYTTKKNGSGIGLSLSKQIMQMHQGTLSVESTPGKTVFTLHF